MFTLGQERFLEESSKPQPIMFTAGAVPVMNEKGEISMKKVKVKRYVAGKKPEWAPEAELDRDSEDDENEKFDNKMNSDRYFEDESRYVKSYEYHRETNESNTEDSHKDRRLQRLMGRHQDTSDQDRDTRLRQRRNFEPEVISEGEVSEPEERRPYSNKVTVVEEESSDEEDLDENEIEHRRLLLRQKVQAKRQLEEELLDQMQQTADVQVKEEELDKVESSDDEEEYTSESEYSDSEDEGPRLKPVFVRKKDRITIQEREEEERLKNSEEIARKTVDERRKYTLQLVEKEARIEVEEENKLRESVNMVDSDDGNDEDEYEAWKLRELKRIKRERDERDAQQKAKEEIERMKTMTEEERRAELRNNPKIVTNQMQKGKYKFLQKYYHRGAFYLDKEEDTLKRDITNPTLEDHFDKSVLPKVMQVKNFGRSGRTKYTHLLDQDTTAYDSPWNQDNALTGKFMVNKAGGMKQHFERPSTKKK